MINFLQSARYLYRMSKAKTKRRYINLLKIIFNNRARRILEIGTFEGHRAVEMIQTANIFYPVEEIKYIGFDLFELLSEEKLKEEFSPHPPSIEVVQDRLKKTGAQITLYQGDTRITLPKLKDQLGNFDFIFIDGGHSVETISSDWNLVKELMHDKTTVVFDDYFTNPCSWLGGLGCQSIVDNLDKNIYKVKILKPKDIYVTEKGIIETNLVKVTKRLIFT